jgi:aldehyde dehydrogenase (NAD+)/betaine-aldehyde dehydrogenase
LIQVKLLEKLKNKAIYIADYYDYYAGLADKVEGTVLPIDKPNIQAITTRIPIGVIAAIIPMEFTNVFNCNKTGSCSSNG